MTCLRRKAVEKIPWHGVLTSVQPRIRLGRSFDQRSHTYLGYALRVRGNIGSEVREFLVGVGEGAHAKHLWLANCYGRADLPVIGCASELALAFGTHPVAVKRSDPRNVL